MTSLGTAVVTGASSGIGEAFARRLARGPYDLVVTARRGERLEALKAELEARHGIRVEALVADLSLDDECRRVAERIAAIDDLAMLVHAAGFGTRGGFATKDVDSQVAMVQVHDVAALRLARAALPRMIERRRGAIILVSSVAAWTSAADGGAYGASKAFLNAFCEGLQAEVADTDVRIQALCPGFTVTEFHGTAEWAGFRRSSVPGFLWMSADQVVVRSLAALRSDQVVVVTGLLNQVYVGLTCFGFVRAIARRVAAILRL